MLILLGRGRRPKRLAGLVLTLLSTMVALATSAGNASAQTSANVLVVINDASPASVEIGEYYAGLRRVPSGNIVRLNTSVTDAISRTDYELTIERPIWAWLASNRLHDQILYVVLTKGIPLRIEGTTGLNGTMSSVDSELTVLYRKMTGASVSTVGRLENPYFLGERPPAEARPFTREALDIYLVTRLDGFSVTDVRRLIERSLSPSRDGRIVLDQRAAPGDRAGDLWLERTADRLDAAGARERTVLETTRALAGTDGPVLGYFSWGSNDPANHLRAFGMSFVPGAVGGMFVSTDGRTFTEPPADWRPGTIAGRGYGAQSLAGDLIRSGITGVAAYVAEPYLDGTIRPQTLFPTYLGGLNLAESYYLSMPFLSWQAVVVGDPLCAPFRERVLPPSELYRPIDPATDLPGFFSDRMVERIAAPGLSPDAVRKLLLAEARLQSKDDAGAASLLREALDLEPRLGAAGLLLAGLHEKTNDHASAVEVYRTVVAADPRNVVALNNLAYSLAVRFDRPAEGLPFAERAVTILPAAAMLDTLGWIQHLVGDNASASRHLERAVSIAPTELDILVHAAIVSAELGDRIRARRQLDAAIKLDPAAAERADVKALRARIGGGWPLPGAEDPPRGGLRELKSAEFGILVASFDRGIHHHLPKSPVRSDLSGRPAPGGERT